MEEKEVLTMEEAAEFLRMDKLTLGRLCIDGKIPNRKPGRKRLFSRTALKNWLANQDQPIATT